MAGSPRSKNEDGQWAQHLLRSGLPFEHLVSEAILARPMIVSGPYSFRREAGNESAQESSVDLLASALLGGPLAHGANFVEMLVECKYCHPGTDWFFAPNPSYESLDYPPGMVMDIFSLDDSSPRWIGLRGLRSRQCGRGVAVERKNGDETRQIMHGLDQLRYGACRRAYESLESDLQALGREVSEKGTLMAGSVQIILPVLVTTSRLWILKDDMTLDTLGSAGSPEDIAESVDRLCSFQTAGPMLSAYCRDLEVDVRNRFPGYPEVFHRFPEFAATKGKSVGVWGGGRFAIESMRSMIRDLSGLVSVVSFSALDSWVRDSLVAAGAGSIERP